MKKLIITLLFFAFIPLVAGIRINEIFPNPTGDDNNKEYVEIFHEEFVNLSGYIIGDETSNDTLIAFQYANSSYSLIVEEGFNYTYINASVYSVGATIGNNLGNTADSVYFFSPNGTRIDFFSYTAIDEGKSYEYYTKRWHMTKNRTPGFENNIYLNDTFEPPIQDTTNMTTNTTTQTNTTTNTTSNTTINQTITPANILKISSLLPNSSYINQTLTKGFRIDHLGKGKIDALLTYIVYFNSTVLKNQTILLENISRYRTKDTIEVTFAFAGNYTICGFVNGRGEEDYTDNTICTEIIAIDYTQLNCDRTLTIKTNQTIFQNKKKISYDFIVEGDNPEIPFIISYFIQEFSGQIVKDTQQTSTDSIKHWTPNIDTEYGLFTIHAKLIETGCNDTIASNNIAHTDIIVKNTREEEGNIAIEHVYLGTDGIVRTGDNVRVKMNIYTGNLSRLSTDKKSIKIYIKDDNNKPVSDISLFSPEKSFQNIAFIIPSFLDYSCVDFPTSETQYTLIAEGLGMTAKQKLPVQGVNKERCSSSSQGEYQRMAFTTTTHPGENITANITIHNIDDAPHTYKVSSKIYRGPKTYSGDFFENQKQIELLPGQQKEIILENTVPVIEPGTYKVKIYVQKDEQKTLKQFTSDIEIRGEANIKQHTANIISFTSLSTELKKEIVLLAEVNSTENYTLILDTIIDTQEKNIVPGMNIITFNTTLFNSKNIFVIHVMDEKEIIDTKSFILFANEDVQEILVHSPATSSLNTITGHVVLEPAKGLKENYDSAMLRVYALIGTVVFLSCYIIYKKKHNLFKTTTLSADYEEHY